MDKQLTPAVAGGSSAVRAHSKVRQLAAMASVCIAIALPWNAAFADSAAFGQLSAQWWQWALSIPVAVNPMRDATGENCVVGQRGATWFLAGVFGSGPVTVTRNCSVPEDAILFFPIVNAVNIDTPNVCGQGPTSFTVAELRAFSAAFIDGVTKVSLTVDGRAVRQVRRVRSPVFEVALPEVNVFDEFCTDLGGVPAGIFSPAVDEGYYARLMDLPVGNHTIRFTAESATGVLQDVTYNLKVVPLSLK